MTLILESLSYFQVKGFWKLKKSLFDNITSELNCGSATRSMDGNGTAERACGWRETQLIYFVAVCCPVIVLAARFGSANVW